MLLAVRSQAASLTECLANQGQKRGASDAQSVLGFLFFGLRLGLCFTLICKAELLAVLVAQRTFESFVGHAQLCPPMHRRGRHLRPKSVGTRRLSGGRQLEVTTSPSELGSTKKGLLRACAVL